VGMRQWFESHGYLTPHNAYYPYVLEIFYNLAIVETDLFTVGEGTKQDKRIKESISSRHNKIHKEQ